MNTEDKDTLDSLVQEKLDTDTDFLDSLADLSDEEKDDAINEKKSEITKQVFTEIHEKANKNEELAKNYKIRAEKAEKAEGKKPKAGEEAPKIPTDEDNLSSKDLYSLMDAKVPQADIEEVIRAAKLLNKTISEALKDDLVVSILEKRAEYRTTANATNTTTARAGVKKITGKELLEKANKGEIPEKGSAEAEELFWEKRGGRRQ